MSKIAKFTLIDVQADQIELDPDLSEEIRNFQNGAVLQPDSDILSVRAALHILIANPPMVHKKGERYQLLTRPAAWWLIQRVGPKAKITCLVAGRFLEAEKLREYSNLAQNFDRLNAPALALSVPNLMRWFGKILNQRELAAWFLVKTRDYRATNKRLEMEQEQENSRIRLELEQRALTPSGGING